MKGRKFLSIICALVMMFAISIAIVDAKQVSAAETAKYYYGTSLVSSESGSPSITSSLTDGVKVTFKKANESASVSYKHDLYAKSFAISFKSTSANFDELWFKLADADNDTKWVKVTLKQADGKIQYKLEDNEKNKTEYADTGIDASKFAEGMTLSLADKNFKLDSKEFDEGSVKTLSFYKNIANLSYGVAGVDKDGEDAVVLVTKINEQSLVTNNSRFEEENRKAPVIISKEDGVDAPVTTAINADVNAPANEDYTFAYYCLDVLGTGWAVSVDDGDKENGKLTLAVGDINSEKMVVKIYATDASETALITLNVTAVNDTQKVVLSDADGFKAFIAQEMNDDLQKGHLVATTEGNTYEFPHVYRDDFNAYFDCIGIDSFDNVKIQVGYKAPGDDGNYTYASSYAVKINETGLWYFVYKVTDIAGNETVSEPFSIRVFDETAPTISVKDSVEIVEGEKYTIPSASITDNASGVDSRYTKWTLYAVDEQGNRTEVKNVKLGEEGYDESLLKDGVLTPAQAGTKYVVVYEARDNAGNIAANEEMEIEVVESTPTYTENPFNNFVKTALIVVACLAGLGIIILIFVRPKESTLK